MAFKDAEFRVQTVPNFYPHARQMRDKVVDFFSNQHLASRDKNFKVNFWHVPDCYCYMRIHTDDILGHDLTTDFHRHLSSYAQGALGLNHVSGSFLSIYVNGMFQTCHSDQLNGTYGWVFSLTDWENRTFSGGETQVANPEQFDHTLPRDHRSQAVYWESIPNYFNSLVLFDDRVAHQVPVISGQLDPLKGRIVVHGHFY